MLKIGVGEGAMAKAKGGRGAFDEPGFHGVLAGERSEFVPI
jgi:hypothetical protein